MSDFVLSAAKFLVVLFLLGIVGSLVVIVITFIEDLDIFFQHEESTDESGLSTSPQR